jgi:glutathione S-transferase
MSEPHITVYRLQACPYCERVIRTLNDLGLEYDSRFVEARHSRRDVVKRVSGKRTVPALVDERTGVTMSESAAIVDYLEATYGSGGPGAADDEGTAARADGGD